MYMLITQYQFLGMESRSTISYRFLIKETRSRYVDFRRILERLVP